MNQLWLQILKFLARLTLIYLESAQPSLAVPADENVKAWEGELLALIAAGQGQAVRDAFWSLEYFNGFAQVALSGAQLHPAPALSRAFIGGMIRLPFRWL